MHRKIDPIPNNEIAEIYSIPFSTENQKVLTFIGMTTQKFKERFEEHITDIKFNRPSTGLSRLHQDCRI